MPNWNQNPDEESGEALPLSNDARNHPGPVRDESKRAEVREHGWVEPTPFDYEAATARPARIGDNLATGDSEVLWAHKAARYEWSEEYGDVGPAIPELEQQLFRDEKINRKGLKFDRLLSIKVTAEATERPAPIRSFRDAGLHPIMVENIGKCAYEIPTPIQAYTIPAVMQGYDIIATAQTGSGKTAAFLIPALSKLMGKARKLAAPRPGLNNGFNPDTDRVRAEPLILVVAPTRELCCQIFDEARRLCYRTMLRPCVAYGGGPRREQEEELRKGCDILVATPGRLRDFMDKTHLLSLARLKFTIIDEADEMLQDDWEVEMKAIMSGGDANTDDQHQYMLFSATFGKEMRKVAKRFLKNDHVRIRIGRAGSVHGNVTQQIVWVEKNKKQEALYDLLISTPPARTLIFVKSKKTADFVDDFLFNNGLPSTSIHSDRTQREREDAMRAFRTGVAPILVATGVSGRGLDVKNVLHVVNFDLPSVEFNGEDEYIHRIGRTARIGNEGLATSFYNDADEPLAPFLAKILVECKQEVPDFLQQYAPKEDEPLDFNDDSGVEENDELANEGAENGDAWGGGTVGNTATPAIEDNWGTTGGEGTGGAGW